MINYYGTSLMIILIFDRVIRFHYTIYGSKKIK